MPLVIEHLADMLNVTDEQRAFFVMWASAPA